MQPSAGNEEETMEQSEKVTSEAEMNETLHDLQSVDGTSFFILGGGNFVLNKTSVAVDAMLYKEVLSFLKEFKESREGEQNQDEVAESGGYEEDDPADLEYSGTNYSPAPPEQFEDHRHSYEELQRKPKAITFVDEVRIRIGRNIADLYVDTVNFPFQKSLGQQYLQKYRELRRQRQPLVFPRSAYGQILPDGVVIYDRDPDGSFGHGYTEEAVRFDPSPPQEPAMNYEYFGASDSAAQDFGVGRYTRQMTSADRANAAAAAAAAATAAENKGSFPPLCIYIVGEAKPEG